MPQHNDLIPYTEYKGQNIIPNAKKDRFNNPEGGGYDLPRDGAFPGFKIAVLHLYTGLYTGEVFDFSLPAEALRKKGFEIIHWKDRLPDLETFKKGLAEACQFWLIPTGEPLLTPEYIDLIIKFFNEGKGLYLWGDNIPLYSDTNVLLKILFSCQMFGNTWADTMIGVKTNNSKSGIIEKHPISTGIENFYEGHTIATIEQSDMLTPLVYGSAGQIVASFYDRNGKRAITDGGFTRLYYKWQSAGTARYVVNAAAWLVNYERFGTAMPEETKANIFDKFDKKGNSSNSSNKPGTITDINDIFNKF